jgi:nitroreductase
MRKVKVLIKRIYFGLKYFNNIFLNENSEKVIRWASMTPRRSSFYYFFYSSKFDREHQSVLNGKLAHIGLNKNFSAHEATLRRNIHRLEKGLISIPRRELFAQDYILETISSYEALTLLSEDIDTLKWANDVLVEYFKVIKTNEITSIAKERFYKIKTTYKTDIEKTEQFIPYARTGSVKSNIVYDEFLKLTKQRRSVRWYIDKKVPKDVISLAISAALLSPSACNRQPFRIVLVDDPDELKVAGFLPMGAVTFAHNIPMLAILIGDLSSYFDERDRHIIYIDGGLFAMSFMYALETLGLSSCPINWPDIEEREKKLTEYLGLSVHERCIMFISIGYALDEGMIPFSQKKSLKSIISES